MKHKPYNIKAPHSYKPVSHGMMLTEDLTLERKKAVTLFLAVHEVIQGLNRSVPSYELVREYEELNQDLRDIVHRYK